MHIPPPPPPGRVLGVATHHSATFLYRIVQPLRLLPSASWATWASVTAEQLQAADTIVISCLGGKALDVARTIADLRTRWGIRRILVDYDDALFHDHPVVEVRPPRRMRTGWRLALSAADGIIVTGVDLAAHLAMHTDTPIAIVPNLVWPDDWPAPQPTDGPPVVVLAGSPSHRLDWDQAITALRWLRKARPEVQLRVLGCPHPEVMDLATDYRPWTTDLADYQRGLAGGAIGLCPLPWTPFNSCKSPIKAYEYALSGMAVIGSPTQYGALLEGRGLIVADDDPAGWVFALATYLDAPHWRQAAAARLREHVLATVDARAHAASLAAIYDRPLKETPHAR